MAGTTSTPGTSGTTGTSATPNPAATPATGPHAAVPALATTVDRAHQTPRPDNPGLAAVPAPAVTVDRAHATPRPDNPGPVTADIDVARVQAMARGDSLGLADLYGRYAPVLLATARRILGEPRGAEDLVHDVFLEAWRQAHTYDPDRGSVRTWLLVRLRSRALDRCRSAALRRTVSVVPDMIAEAHDVSELPDHRILHSVLGDLPGEQRQVLEHAYFAGLSATEIAALLQIPVGTVKSRLGAGLKKLRSALGAGSKERA